MAGSQEVQVATVQLVLPAHIQPEQAAAHLGALLAEAVADGRLLDWRYLRVGGQQLSPTPRLVPDPYREGDAFSSGPPR